MSFLEWLTGMALMFWGWSLPIALGVSYINESKGNIVIGILICSLAIPIEILLYRLHKKFESEETKKKREREQALEQERIERMERIKAENKEREERIKASPVKNLTPLQFEEFTKLYLEERNYKQVTLTRTSGDFGADVVAIAPDKARVCVQCKKYSKPVGISAVQEIHSAKSYYKCERAAVVVSSAGFTKQAIELSEKVNVALFVFDDYAHEFKPVNRDARFIMSTLSI